MSPLIITAISLGVIHTAIGPDHYIPFVALSKANNWSYRKTMFISTICGLGHCLSSVVIGLIGIGLGLMIGKIELIEGVRGDIASYMMIAFGLIYFGWSIKSIITNKVHTHKHKHGSLWHSHKHTHKNEHLHGHDKKNRNIVWGMFIIFVLGPCEPLIPILMYPAIKLSLVELSMVILAFTISTVLVMLVTITIVIKGITFVNINHFEKYGHSIASLSIVSCGVLIIVGF